MPAPVSQLLKYADEVDVNVAPQQVNLVDSDSYGHRVSVSVLTSALQNAFSWRRAVGSARPVGHFNDTSGALQAAIAASLNSSYTDTDAVSGKLSFDSATLTSNTDPRIREGGNVSANDLLMAYVLYKVYGSSAASTADMVFNLQDAYGMLTTADYAAALIASFNTAESHADASGNEKGAVDAMFRDLLAADSLRFFDASGNQIPGLFEVNADVSGAGNWNLVAGDKIEVRTKFTFLNSVTLRTSKDVAQNLNPLPTQANDETTFIEAGSFFNIRLQLTASDSGPGGVVPSSTPVIVNGVLTGYTGAVPASVTLGGNVSGIASSAVFANNTSLRAIDMSATSITTLPTSAFSGCTALTLVVLPPGLLAISENCFNGCTSLMALTIPASVASLGANSFAGCPAVLTIPANFNLAAWQAALAAAGSTGSIYQVASTPHISGGQLTGFTGAVPASVTLGANVTSVVATVFTNATTLLRIDMSASGLTALPDAMFYGCTSLTSVALPSALNTIGNSVFNGCSALVAPLTLPASMTTIGTSVFTGCGALGTVTLASSLNKASWTTKLTAADFSGSIVGGATTAPDAPTGVSATAGNASIAVSWTAPANNGGAAITGYKVYANGSLMTTSASTSANLSGLVNGTAYAVTVVASNSVGDSAASASASATPNTTPSAPQNVSATEDNASISVSWSAPASDGGAAITGYKVFLDGSVAATTASTSYNLTGLTNGTAYSVTVKATNVDGDGEASAAISITPNTVPSAPRSVAVTAGNGSLAVSWSAPASNGGLAVTAYKVYLDGSSTAAAATAGTSATLSGLTNGTSYSVTVTAVNSDGESVPSAAVSGTPAVPATAPGPVQNLVAVSGSNGSSAVSWSAPASNGGSAITGYQVYYGIVGSSLSLFATVTVTSVTITGMTNDEVYNISIIAVNSVGSSPAPANPPQVAPTARTYIVSGGVLTGFVGGLAPKHVILGPDVYYLGGPYIYSSSVFYHNTELRSIDMGASQITFLPYNAFNQCNALTSVILPHGITALYNGAFDVSPSLTSIVFPNTLQFIDQIAFAACPLLTSITLPASMTGLGVDAFASCPRLGTVTIPVSFNLNTWRTKLQTAAFYGNIIQV